VTGRVRAGVDKFLRNESGQIVVLAAVMMVALCSAMALVIDVGRLMYSQRELQESTDAAALAAAGALQIYKSSGTATSTGQQFGASTGQNNASSNLGTVSMMPGSPALKCLKTLLAQGVACVGAAPYNAVQVKQQAVVPMYFAGLLGHSTVTVTASATAAVNGGAPTPYNIAVIIDSTLSMNANDSDCGNTQMQCALNGFQILLKSLNPCAQQLTTCTIANGMSANSVDRVSLFTFPSVLTSTLSVDSSCTSAVPSSYIYDSTYGYYVMPNYPPYSKIATATSYWFPVPGALVAGSGSTYGVNPMNGTVTSTYQVLPFMSDYKTADTATVLNPASAMVKAAGGVANCGGLAPSNYDGVYGTYYAAALYQAQSALIAEQAQFPGSQNALIILSDGDSNAPQTNPAPPANPAYYVYNTGATSTGIYPSWIGQCGQAVVAAKAAAVAGTRVYSVGYGSEPTGCASDASAGTYPNITPCNTMAAMASAPQYFYSDYNQTGSGSTCVASQAVTSLSGIFKAIAADLSTPRLIPDNTT
jgi:Flp pilus assembly protein TadG